LTASVPAITVALAVGIALAMAFEPAFQPKADASATGWEWMSFKLWPQLANYDLSRLLMIGMPGALTLTLVMILETFTTASLMETRCGIRVDPNREMIILGLANGLSAVLGGVPATMHPARSLANWIGGGRGRLAAITTLVLTGCMLFFAASWLAVLPAGIVAGLFLIQASLLADRVFLARFGTMLRKRQWLVDGRLDVGLWMSLLIAMVAYFGSLIWACSLGVALSSLVVLRRVSSNLVAHWGYLDQHTSRRVRSRSDLANLQRMAHRVGVLRLTGHLFFGNSARLSQLVEELHADARSVVVDVAQVSDVDPSGVAAMLGVIKTLLDRNCTVVLTGLQRTRSTELRRALSTITGVETRTDLDRGLELCEELLLQSATVSASPLKSTSLEKNVLLQDLSPDEITTVLMLGEKRHVAKGTPLFRRDALADGIWLLEEGIVSILANDSDSAARLSTFGPSQFLGEMGFIDGKTRSATALADSPVTAFLLDTRAIDTLIRDQPTTALKITRNIARELSYRMRSTSALMAEANSENLSEWPNG
jgi:SulP family sulfate permease